jgi:DNA-directed RNA polymerase subunit RPC12/RpoP
MDESKKKPFASIFRGLSLNSLDNEALETSPLELTPAMPELGTAPCPVCGHRVAVFVTRTKRPFINCGHCSVRVFYNGSRSMELLKQQIEAAAKSVRDIGAEAADGLKSIVKGKE